MSPRSPLYVLAFCVALAALSAGVAGAVGVVPDAAGEGDRPDLTGGIATVTEVSNTTNYLSTGVPDRRSYVESDVDVTAAAGMSASRLHAEHSNRAFDTRFESASETDQARISVVRETADRVESQFERLDERHATILRAYSNGSLSREAFLRRLARLSVAAEATQSHVAHVERRVDATPGLTTPVDLDTRLSDIQATIVTLPNPVMRRVQRGLAGTDTPVVVYAGGVEQGIVFSMITDGTVVRTATLRDEFAPDQPDQFSAQSDRSAGFVVFQRGSELYPYAYDNAIGTPQISSFGDTSGYIIGVDYPRGQLESYISGGTTNVFHEVQTKRLEAIPLTDAVVRENNSLAVTVETTSGTGPMRISLIQPSTDAPLDGTILVDGEVVGRTGQDGQLWTTHPGGQFTVNATTGANAVEVRVS